MNVGISNCQVMFAALCQVAAERERRERERERERERDFMRRESERERERERGREKERQGRLYYERALQEALVSIKP